MKQSVSHYLLLIPFRVRRLMKQWLFYMSVYIDVKLPSGPEVHLDHEDLEGQYLPKIRKYRYKFVSAII